MGESQGLREALVIQGMFQPLQRPSVGDAGCRGEGRGWSARTSRVGIRGDALFLLGSGWMRHEGGRGEEAGKGGVGQGRGEWSGLPGTGGPSIVRIAVGS